MVGDLWALYRFNVDEISSPLMVRAGFELVARLAHEPYSAWRANTFGSAFMFGWGCEAEALAGLIDTFTVFAGSFGKRRPKFVPYAGRPEPRKKTTVPAVSIAQAVQLLTK